MLTALSIPSQDYSVDWHVIGGGGGQSTGSVYTVTGTLGQPAASRVLTNATTHFSVVGGFWSLLRVVQIPDGLRVDISLTSSNTAIVSWPASETNLVLRQSGTLPAANWSPVPEPVFDDGTVRYIVVKPPAGSRFFRLMQP